MKKTLFATTLIAVLFATQAFADGKTIGGCQVAQPDGGNFYFRVDPSCNLFNNQNKSGEREVVIPDSDEDTAQK